MTKRSATADTSTGNTTAQASALSPSGTKSDADALALSPAKMRELSRLSKRQQQALKDAEKRRRPHRLRLAPIPDDLAHLFCPTCKKFISVMGCPKHGGEQPLPATHTHKEPALQPALL